jgi:hypothetical protein
MEGGVVCNAAALRDDDPSFAGADWKCRILFRRLLGKTPGQLRSGLATWVERVGRTGDLPKLTVGQAFWFVADLMI